MFLQSLRCFRGLSDCHGIGIARRMAGVPQDTGLHAKHATEAAVPCSCYAASVLQCLLQTPGITEYLACSSHSPNCTALPTKWCLLCELQRLLNSPDVHSYRPASFLRLNRSIGPSRACSVKPFIDHVEEIGPDFSVGQQEDAHEFFVQLLDRIESIMLAEAGGRRLFNHRSQVSCPDVLISDCQCQQAHAGLAFLKI